jgi:hypothetical protein
MVRDRARAGEVQLPVVRDDHAAAGAVPCDRARLCRPEPAGDDAGGEVCQPPAAQSAERALCTYRPGDNLYTNSAISWDPDTGKMNWFFQFTPGDMWDYDEVGTHILIDGEVAGQPRKLITHSARNGFLYTMDRHNGQIIGAKPYMDNVNWTKGIDQKTGKPIDYDPNKDIQTYAGVGNLVQRLSPQHRSALDGMLKLRSGSKITMLAWLRQSPGAPNGPTASAAT